jgi:hypothetical protein
MRHPVGDSLTLRAFEPRATTEVIEDEEHPPVVFTERIGWSVASIQSVVGEYSIDPATQTPHSSTTWMVVIQRGGK